MRGSGHPGFPKLTDLELSRTSLNDKDAVDLCDAIGAGKFPLLTFLSLACNMFNKTAVQRLAQVITEHNLPHLNELNLSGSGFCFPEREREVDALITACDGHYNVLELRLFGYGLSTEFKKTCRDRFLNVVIRWVE